MGIFITLEGTEGAGKSTQVRLLHETLVKEGFQVVVTREPGGTVVGERIRKTLLDVSSEKIEPLSELFLFLSCRVQLINQVILPELKAGKIVICDRFSDATIAYQGFARELPCETVIQADNIATGGLKPDMTLLLDIPVEKGLKRLANREEKNRIDNEHLSFHEKVRNGYLHIGQKDKERVKIIDADKSQEELAKIIEELTISFVRRNSHKL